MSGGFSEANWRECQSRLKDNDEWLKKIDLQGHERGVKGALQLRTALAQVGIASEVTTLFKNAAAEHSVQVLKLSRQQWWRRVHGALRTTP